VEDEEEGEEQTAGEQDISKKICTYEQPLHCISEVMQFAIDSNSSSLLELLYTVKTTFKNTRSQKKVKTSLLLDLWKKSQ
jgi:hypothetical protein